MLFSPNCVSTLRGSYCRKWPGLGQSTLRGARLFHSNIFSRNPLGTLCVADRSRCGKANFKYRSRNLLGNLRASDLSRHGAMLIFADSLRSW